MFKDRSDCLSVSRFWISFDDLIIILLYPITALHDPGSGFEDDQLMGVDFGFRF
jgi:hypothetical protein